MDKISDQLFLALGELDDDFFLKIAETINQHGINMLIDING